MKKLILIAMIITVSCTGDKKCLVEIPDVHFRVVLKRKVPNAFVGDKLDPNYEDVQRLKNLTLPRFEIESLEGIEYFTGLERLTCIRNKLTSLDVTHNTELMYIRCIGNTALTSLDVTHNMKLRALVCDHNALTSLDVSQNTELKMLDCYGNNLKRLDLSHNPLLNKRNVYADEGVKIIWYKK